MKLVLGKDEKEKIVNNSNISKADSILYFKLKKISIAVRLWWIHLMLWVHSMKCIINS